MHLSRPTLDTQLPQLSETKRRFNTKKFLNITISQMIIQNLIWIQHWLCSWFFNQTLNSQLALLFQTGNIIQQNHAFYKIRHSDVRCFKHWQKDCSASSSDKLEVDWFMSIFPDLLPTNLFTSCPKQTQQKVRRGQNMDIWDLLLLCL